MPLWHCGKQLVQVEDLDNGGDQPSAREGLPWASLGRGAGLDCPGHGSVEAPARPSSVWCASRKKRNQKPTLRKKEDNKGEEVLPQQPRILVEKTRGFRRIVSPRMKSKRGQPKLLSPNRSFEPKSGRRGTNIKRRERKNKKEITKSGKSGRITRDPLRPPGACESACACYPELSLFMPC